MVRQLECLLVAQSGRHARGRGCPMSALKRTSQLALPGSACDPKRTSSSQLNGLCTARATNYVAPPSTLPALTEQLMPFTVVDFISRYFFDMGLNVMLVLPGWNARATLALQLVKLASKSTEVR